MLCLVQRCLQGFAIVATLLGDAALQLRDATLYLASLYEFDTPVSLAEVLLACHTRLKKHATTQCIKLSFFGCTHIVREDGTRQQPLKRTHVSLADLP